MTCTGRTPSLGHGFQLHQGPDGRWTLYGPGEQLPLTFRSKPLALAEWFRIMAARASAASKLLAR
jgi:hypothetical protein